MWEFMGCYWILRFRLVGVNLNISELDVKGISLDMNGIYCELTPKNGDLMAFTGQ